MPKNSPSLLVPHGSSFLLGVAATLAAGALLRQWSSGYRREHDDKESSDGTATTSRGLSNDYKTLPVNPAAEVNGSSTAASSDTNGNTSNTRQGQSTDVMDAPDLDLRLIRKAEAVIQWRSGNLTVVVERSTNSWNHSAILRTAEALGVHHVWIVDPDASRDEISTLAQDDHDDDEQAASHKIRDKKNRLLHLSSEEAEQRRQHHLFARNATEWLSLREFETAKDCIAALRETGHAIYVTDLSQKAVELTEPDLQRHSKWPLPQKIALVFGTEAVGCSEEMLQAADLRVYLPLRGFADSLNLSVAAALVIHHVLVLEPRYVASMTEEERHALRQQWYPKLARQRLLSTSDKRRRKRLLSEISRGETLKVQQEQGVYMTESQMNRINILDDNRKELKELEEKGQFDASDQIVQELVSNPPEPLSDLRRADAHRVTFAGKGVKSKNAENWKGLATVTGVQSVERSTAGFFRSKLAAILANQDDGQ